MPHRHDAVLFDLDGTLLDTAPDFVTAINRVLAERGLPPHPESMVRAAVSHGSAGLIAATFDLEASHPDFEPLRQALLAHYRTCLTDETRLFPGMERVLEALAVRGIPWGIVTNKPAQYTDAIVARLPWPSPPATVICPDHVTRTKPDPEPVLLACRQLDLAPGRAIYVGDHLRDIEAGRGAGTATVAAAYGYLDADENPAEWGADHIIERADQLIDILF
ncbi:MAG TPA: HAD-IA family hydrolase [Porticoccaceae bacterium]|nr:HAD-IA family hydrolase [Porticoccaceae bacterium]